MYINQSEIYVTTFHSSSLTPVSIDMAKVVLEMKCSDRQSQSPHTGNEEYIM